ncbi:MAG: hypothetical protein KF857_05730 [Fimbriimonadaceae bacterium]|nr:hypothetical protein [Fimbriimonadaceae bacterium]
MKIFKVSSLVVAAVAVAGSAHAQAATPEQMGDFAGKPGMAVMHLQTNLGSFKVIDGKGRIDVTFTGTVLVTKYNGKELQVSGKVRKEYDKNGRTLFTGTGRIVASGEWRGFQWFGKNMSAVWYGSGAIRLAGEFDRNFKTGDYWYDNAEEKQAFPATSVLTVYLPKPDFQGNQTAVPRERKKGGG